MAEAKVFNNIIIGQFVLAGLPVKVYTGGRYLLITSPEDVQDVRVGFGMDVDGRMIPYSYPSVEFLNIMGNQITIEKYNEAMAAKAGGEKPNPEPKADDAEDKEKKDAPGMSDSIMPKLATLLEQSPEVEKFNKEIENLNKKKQDLQNKIIKAKEKKLDAEKEELGEDHAAMPGTYTFGVGDVIKNTNPGCAHFGSKGIVIALTPAGVKYTVTNGGPTDMFKPGDILTKTPDQLEYMEELNVRDVHGDKKIENPKTGKKIKFSSALKAKKGTKVYSKARKMYNRLKEK